MVSELAKQVEVVSNLYNFPEGFISAIVLVESLGDVAAMRYEPNYSYLWNYRTNSPVRFSGSILHPGTEFGGPGFISKETELVGQRTSWGPMQVMGAVAREYGFTGFFPELCTADVGVRYGCMHLAKLRRRFDLGYDNLMELATAYNTGSPKDESHPYWRKIKEARTALIYNQHGL